MQFPDSPGAVFVDATLKEEARAEQERFKERFGTDRRVLLIGGGGYIGSPVASRLLRYGMMVRNLDAFVYPTQGSVSGLLLEPGYELLVGDFGDGETLDSALEGVTDVVILGGLVGDPITKSCPELAHRINTEAVQRLLAELAKRDLNKVIFVSTCSNYGLMEDGKLATEDSELRPLSLYAEAKVAAERAFFAQPDWKGCPTVLRFATAFGAAPRTRFDLTVNEFTRELFVDNELVVFDADTWRPYCHVRDFARLIHMVLAADPKRVRGAIFNAGGDINNHTKQSIVNIITARLPDRRVAYREVGSDPRNYRVDFSRVRTVLGFEPEWSVEAGVDELIAQLEAGFFNDFGGNADFYGNYSIDEARLSA